ncbi:hypothetical protein ACQCSX_08715 [Pseudarthrobacter sp. P1]|uniref:hypothetical protein n=1 Tax=Pseudarthrobacter sp. P1 TaxID=3418418 RepID=UPI003CF7F5F0
MSSNKVIAYCHRRKGAHKLVELVAVDGKPGVRCAEAVGGLSVRKNKSRGQFDIGQHWATVPLDSPDIDAGLPLYCEACGSEYFVPSLRLLVANALKSGKPEILRPLTASETSAAKLLLA